MKKTYIYLDSRLAVENKLNQGQALVYKFISDFTKKGKPCFCSVSHMAKKLMASESTIRNQLKALEQEKKLVWSVKQGRMTFWYAVLDEEQATPPANDEIPEFPLVSVSVSASAKISGQDFKICNPKRKICDIHNRIHKKKKIPPYPLSPAADEEKREGAFWERNKNFEIAWSAYPRKNAKEAARKAWHKLGSDDCLPGMDVILKSINTQKKQESWNRNEGRYIPYFVTWLRDMRFADEIEEISPEVQQLQEARLKTEQVFSSPSPEITVLREKFDKFCRNQKEKIYYAPHMKSYIFGFWSNLYKRRIVTEKTMIDPGNLLTGLKRAAGRWEYA